MGGDFGNAVLVVGGGGGRLGGGAKFEYGLREGGLGAVGEE